MLYRYTTEFQIEDDAIAFRKEYLSKGEIEAEYKEKDDQQLEDTVEPISDNKEDNKDDTQEVVVLVQAESGLQRPSERSLGKRRKSVTSESDIERYSDNNEEEVPLPETQQRVSGRSRKRPRHHDNQFIVY
jgi:hypothetical protein